VQVATIANHKQHNESQQQPLHDESGTPSVFVSVNTKSRSRKTMHAETKKEHAQSDIQSQREAWMGRHEMKYIQH